MNFDKNLLMHMDNENLDLTPSPSPSPIFTLDMNMAMAMAMAKVVTNCAGQKQILLRLYQILMLKVSRKLNHKPLYFYLKNKVLTNSTVVENLITNDEIFKIIYDKHVIKKKMDWVNFKDPLESMALAWLMHLYH